jgi:hypothetical protein
VNKSGADNFASPKRTSPDPEAAIPARNTISPPGKTKPISNPVSIKITPRTPINPRVEMIELASKKLIFKSVSPNENILQANEVNAP